MILISILIYRSENFIIIHTEFLIFIKKVDFETSHFFVDMHSIAYMRTIAVG